MNSIWEKETVLPQYESLKQDLTVDVAVIGGGMAGILTAYLLQKQGCKRSCVRGKDHRQWSNRQNNS